MWEGSVNKERNRNDSKVLTAAAAATVKEKEREAMVNAVKPATVHSSAGRLRLRFIHLELFMSH